MFKTSQKKTKANPTSMSVQAADPYLVLELRRDASSDQIQRAYRKLAMRWHPDRNSTNIDTATERFSNVNESYDVLTNRKLRAILDKQGLVALSNEYKFTKSPKAMFEEFFGTLKGWSLTSNAGRDDIFGKFLILPTTTFFPLVLSMVSRKKKKVSPKLTGEAN